MSGDIRGDCPPLWIDHVAEARTSAPMNQNVLDWLNSALDAEKIKADDEEYVALYNESVATNGEGEYYAPVTQSLQYEDGSWVLRREYHGQHGIIAGYFPPVCEDPTHKALHEAKQEVKYECTKCGKPLDGTPNKECIIHRHIAPIDRTRFSSTTLVLTPEAQANRIEQFAKDIHEAKDENIPQRTRDTLWEAKSWADRREEIEGIAEVLWAMGYRKVESQ